MSGNLITHKQIEVYMKHRKFGGSQEGSAAKAGFSERSARNLEARSFEVSKRQKRWKTRIDPFEDVWESILLPLLSAQPKLEARSLLEHLQALYPDLYPDKQLRTLQRRVKAWKVLHGPEKEIIFRQIHLPGHQGISDFTDASKLCITIRREALPHLLYHFRLSYSGHEFSHVVLGGESFTALSEGLQMALWSIGGVPETHRTDSLAAAYKNLPNKEKEEFTESYTQLCSHYGMKPTRNNKGVSHENGSIESPNGHLKNRIDQALMIRGSRDFDSLQEYRNFIREIDRKTNRRLAAAFAEERKVLKDLPERKTFDYTEVSVRVTSSSTIMVKQVVYSVPSRLIGSLVKVHIYDDRLEYYVGGEMISKIVRLRRNKKRVHHIDYRHVIHSLVRKPQAFRNYTYKEEMFPTFAFRQAWELLDQALDERQACKEYVKILYEAAQPDCENKVNDYLEKCLCSGHLPTSGEVMELFKRMPRCSLQQKKIQPNLHDYEELLANQGGIK